MRKLLDLNVGPAVEIASRDEMASGNCQEVSKLPLCLDSTDYEAIEEDLKYAEPAMINSVPAIQEKMDLVSQP